MEFALLCRCKAPFLLPIHGIGWYNDTRERHVPCFSYINMSDKVADKTRNLFTIQAFRRLAPPLI